MMPYDPFGDDERREIRAGIGMLLIILAGMLLLALAGRGC